MGEDGNGSECWKFFSCRIKTKMMVSMCLNLNRLAYGIVSSHTQKPQRLSISLDLALGDASASQLQHLEHYHSNGEMPESFFFFFSSFLLKNN